MTSFDYLHARRRQSFRQTIERIVPPGLLLPCLGTIAAFSVVVCAWAVQAHRLHRALRAEAAYEMRYEQTDRQVRAASRAVAKERSMERLDKRLQLITGSGYAEARRLAEIANDVPRHAWITTIARRQDGYDVEGGTKSLTSVGALIAALLRARYLRNPLLVNVTRAGMAAGGSSIKYDLRLEATP
jgi:hypothetical protein